MQAVKTIGLDIAKSVFQVHGVDADGQVVIRPSWADTSPAIPHLPFLEIIPAGERVSLATSAPVRACNVVRAGTK